MGGNGLVMHTAFVLTNIILFGVIQGCQSSGDVGACVYLRVTV